MGCCFSSSFKETYASSCVQRSAISGALRVQWLAWPRFDIAESAGQGPVWLALQLRLPPAWRMQPFGPRCPVRKVKSAFPLGRSGCRSEAECFRIPETRY